MGGWETNMNTTETIVTSFGDAAVGLSGLFVSFLEDATAAPTANELNELDELEAA